MQHVAGQDHIVRFAPVVDGLCEPFQKQRVGKVDIKQLHRGHGFAVFAEKQLRQLFPAGKAVPGFKLLKQVVGPRHGAGYDAVFLPAVVKAVAPVGLVGENALDAPPEPVAAARRVLFVGQFDELPGGLPAHGVEIGVPVVV